MVCWLFCGGGGFTHCDPAALHAPSTPQTFTHTAAAAAVCCLLLQDTELLVAAGANDLPLAQAWQQQHGTSLVTVSSVCWAAAVLLSRTFSLDLSEPELPTLADMSYFGSWQAHGPACLVLVPWADMCQHSSDAGALVGCC